MSRRRTIDNESRASIEHHLQRGYLATRVANCRRALTSSPAPTRSLDPDMTPDPPKVLCVDRILALLAGFQAPSLPAQASCDRGSRLPGLSRRSPESLRGSLEPVPRALADAPARRALHYGLAWPARHLDRRADAVRNSMGRAVRAPTRSPSRGGPGNGSSGRGALPSRSQHVGSEPSGEDGKSRQRQPRSRAVLCRSGGGAPSRWLSCSSSPGPRARLRKNVPPEDRRGRELFTFPDVIPGLDNSSYRVAGRPLRLVCGSRSTE